MTYRADRAWQEGYSAKKRGFGQGGGRDEAESLVPVEDDELLLKAVPRATQVLCFDHVSARTQACFAQDGVRGIFTPPSNTYELHEQYPILTPRHFVCLDRAWVITLNRHEAASCICAVAASTSCPTNWGKWSCA
eukprot:6207757-Pleurochrysis_carterae.AAC.2